MEDFNKKLISDVIIGISVSTLFTYLIHRKERKNKLKSLKKIRKDQQKTLERKKREEERKEKEYQLQIRRAEEEKERLRKLKIKETERKIQIINEIEYNLKNEIRLSWEQERYYYEIYKKPYVYKISKRFLNSYLHRWNNLKRWITPYHSAGIYTVLDVYNCKNSQLKYYRETVPGIGDKGYNILVEIKKLAGLVKEGRIYYTSLGTNLHLDCLT